MLSTSTQHPLVRRERQNQSDDLRPLATGRLSVTQTQWNLGLRANKMATVVLGLLCAVGLATAAPARTYDQRQHGELNIHAQLDNIVILLIPSSKINLMDVSPESENNLTHGKPDKNAFLEFLQNHIKNDIDRYDVQPPATTQDENEVLTSQSLNVSHEDKDKDEEVVATVQEMKPEKDSPNQTTVPTKTEATEDTPIKDHSTISESVQETVFKISIPVELKDAVKKAEEKVKTAEKENKEEKESHKVKVEKVPNEAVKPPAVKDFVLLKKEQPQEKKEETTLPKVDHTNVEPLKVSPGSGSTLDALIKPVAARKPETSLESAVSGVRREKVIRYKPEAKWAPGLVDMMGPVRQERQRFASLCAPGLWDPELKTCIMPGETRR